MYVDVKKKWQIRKKFCPNELFYLVISKYVDISYYIF